MTNNQLTREENVQAVFDLKAGYTLGLADVEILKRVARMALAAMNSEPEYLPLDYLQGHRDGLEWSARLAESNHPQTGDWLYDDPIELAKAIRKGPDMPPAQPVAGSEPDRNPVLAYADSYRDMAKQGIESVPIWSVITDLERNIAPLYRHAQPAPDTEREPIAWLNDAYLARGVVDGEAGSEDAGPGYIPVYREASPVQPAPVVLTFEEWCKRSGQKPQGWVRDAMKEAYEGGARSAPERDKVRREHAEWSQTTFGNVGPIGPLKHLSKEALEAAAEPGDLSEWADMQFLLWDAQRRAGITDEQITQAMIEKLAVNKQREWPAPKDGEPQLHIKELPAPVVPDEAQSRAIFEKWCSVNIERNKWHPEFYAHLPAREQWAAWEACRAAMLQAGNSPAIPDGYVIVPKEPTAQMYDAGDRQMATKQVWNAMLAAAPQEVR